MDITLKSIIGFLDSKEKIRIVKKGEVVYSGLVKDLLKNDKKKVLDAVESKIISMYINECLAVNVE
jgi:hypothetical protein